MIVSDILRQLVPITSGAAFQFPGLLDPSAVPWRSSVPVLYGAASAPCLDAKTTRAGKHLPAAQEPSQGTMKEGEAVVKQLCYIKNLGDPMQTFIDLLKDNKYVHVFTPSSTYDTN